MTIASHFSAQTAAYASSKGVPMASILVPLSGIIATLGAISLMLGYKARLGAWLIALFLIPVTLYMHAFWTVSDPMQMQMQMTNFMKNMSLLGSAFMIAYFGAGPLSLDSRISHDTTAEEITEKEQPHKHAA